MQRLKRSYLFAQKWLLVFTVITILFAIALMGFLAYKPLVIHTQDSVFENFLKVGGHQLKLRKVTLWFDGQLHLKGEDGEVFSKKLGETLDIYKVEVEFSNTALLTGRFAPKHLKIEGLNLDINIEPEGFYIGGFPLTLENADKTQQAEQVLSLIEYLNQERHQSPYFAVLKTLEAKNINLNIEDNVNLKSWIIKKGDVNFRRSFVDGETLKLNGELSRPQMFGLTPVNIIFKHPTYADNASVAISIQDANSHFFDDYLPFENPIQATGSMTMTLDMLKNNEVDNMRLAMKMGKGTIHVIPAYNFPFSFASGYVDMQYDYKDDFLTLNKLSLIDNAQWPVEISGTITSFQVPEDLKFDLHLQSLADTTVSQIVGYLPDKRISGVTNWIRTHVNDSKVSNLRLSYTGKPSELPHCDKKCGFDGEFDFKGLSLSFLPHTEPATGMNGHFVMRDDYIKINAESAMVGDQKASNIEALIDGYFTKGKKSGIHITGAVEGPIQSLLNVIEKEVSSTEPWDINISGTHASKGEVYIPFKDLTFSKVKYNFKSQVEKVQTSSIIKGLDLSMPKGDVLVNQDTLTLEGKGFVDEFLADYIWRENMKNPMKETDLTVLGEWPAEAVEKYLPALGLKIEDTVQATLNAKAKKEGGYNYTIYSDLTKNTIEQELLNWEKAKDVSLTVQAEGIFKENGYVSNSPVSIKATGEGVDIQGMLKTGEEFSADFSTFNIGQHKLKVAVKGNMVNLIGQQLDLSYIPLFEKDNEASPSYYIDHMNITANLEKVLFKNGVLNNVNAQLQHENNQWQYVDIQATLKEKPVAFNLSYPSSDHMSLNLKSENVGDLFYIIDFTNALRGGRANIRADIYTVDGKKEGGGLIDIEKTYMVDAPIMARLLSLISLTELLSQKEGIYFTKVEIPLLFAGDEIILDHASLSGPSIGMRLRGKLNTENKNVNMEGQLIPAEGINSLVSKIPLFGALLTGSQSGLLVADFKVKGPIGNTKVSANPLSFVLPGLVKDFFGTLFSREDITKPSSNK